MSLGFLTELYKDLDVYEQRYNSEDYKEFVVFAAELPKWQRIFEDQFGPAEKPFGKEPSPDHLRLTENYGGIHHHQTLFKSEMEVRCIIVMIWPWKDNEHVTLKIAVGK